MKELINPPTEEELCKALSKHDGGGQVIYENGNFYSVDVDKGFKEIMLECMKDNFGNYVIDFCNDSFPPHLITMLGRFYGNNKGKT